MSTTTVHTLTQSDFDTFIASETPTLVDFWAPWCGPCRALGPTIDAIADDLAGKAQVGKVNVDEQSALAQKYGISSIPTVMIFKSGELVKTFVGLRHREDYERALLD